MSRLITITYPDITASTFTYDSRGWRASVTYQNGALSRVRQPLG